MDKGPRTKRIFTGGLVLIALGVLIFLHNTTEYTLGRTWPILLIVVALGILIQAFKDIGGWIIGAAGVLFLLREMMNVDLNLLGTYLLPVLLILLGIMVIMKHYRKRRP